jgi:hypothetical protein
MVGGCGTVFLRPLIDDAHRATGDSCSGLHGWLAFVFVADIVSCPGQGLCNATFRS